MANTRRHRNVPAAFALGLTLGIALPAVADDTEVLVQTLPHDAPNVLLILDTSGSMDSELIVSDSYDPAVTYTGACTADRIYYARHEGTFTLPSCVSTFSWVRQSAFTCRAALDAFAASGFFMDRYAQWNDDDTVLGWTNLQAAGGGSPTLGEDRFVECRTDLGVHGDGRNLEANWPAANKDGPWSDVAALAIGWDVTGDEYTFYDGNYLNWVESATEPVVRTRLDLVKEAAVNLVTSVTGVRMGLMRFSRNGEGGMVLHPVADVATARPDLIATIDALEAGGTTPLAETLYEAGQYYAGGAVDYGLNSTGNRSEPQPSAAEAVDGANYVSPIVGQCQASYTVLLTDGEPNSDTGADDRIEGLPDFLEATGFSTCTESCLDEMSRYLAGHDLATFPETQSVRTYTIGFQSDQQLLLDTATAVRDDNTPGYYTLNDLAGLEAAFGDIVANIEREASTFAAPAMAIDTFNRLETGDDLYIATFMTSAAPHWAGNLKKYRVAPDGEGGIDVLDASDPPRIAVTESGLVDPDSRSFWSSEVDGDDVMRGGVRGRMGSARLVYTDTLGSGEAVPLTADLNRLHEDNEALTAAMLNVDASARDALIRFLRGVDENGDAQPLLGDALHSNPLAVSFGGTPEDPDLALFFTTNDGYFHAVDPTPSTELQNLETFAFVPHEILPRLKDLQDNDVRNPVAKGYGLDGTLTYLIKDDDGDRIVESGERLFVYFGMRRGGRNYYALDVTDRNAPRLAWTISGGSGEFAELGQSWSAATLGRVAIDGAPRDVLFIGGGYDTGQDAAGLPRDDAMGRALYIVDAITGERLWWAANAADYPTANLPLADMVNAVPSDLTVIDVNADGLADRMYVGDMGGRLWRFDIDNSASGSTPSVTGGAIADIGGTDAAGNRRFFYPPSVARVVDQRFGSFLTIALGSGHRPGPLGTDVDDRFYMFRDYAVFAPPTDLNGDPVYTAATDAALADITSDTTPQASLLNGTAGWMLSLTTAGEKVLARALTADNKVFFTSYLPGGYTASCNLSGGIGTGRLYTIDLVTGVPVTYADPLNPLPVERFEDLDRGGIPSEPILVFTVPDCQGDSCEGDDEEPPDDELPPEDMLSGCDNPFSQVTLLVATEARNPQICNAPVRTYWSGNNF